MPARSSSVAATGLIAPGAPCASRGAGDDQAAWVAPAVGVCDEHFPAFDGQAEPVGDAQGVALERDVAAGAGQRGRSVPSVLMVWAMCDAVGRVGRVRAELEALAGQDRGRSNPLRAGRPWRSSWARQLGSPAPVFLTFDPDLELQEGEGSLADPAGRTMLESAPPGALSPSCGCAATVPP